MSKPLIFERSDGRLDDQARPLSLSLDFIKYPEGSVLARAGDTVEARARLCTVE